MPSHTMHQHICKRFVLCALCCCQQPGLLSFIPNEKACGPGIDPHTGLSYLICTLNCTLPAGTECEYRFALPVLLNNRKNLVAQPPLEPAQITTSHRLHFAAPVQVADCRHLHEVVLGCRKTFHKRSDVHRPHLIAKNLHEDQRLNQHSCGARSTSVHHSAKQLLPCIHLSGRSAILQCHAHWGLSRKQPKCACCSGWLWQAPASSPESSGGTPLLPPMWGHGLLITCALHPRAAMPHQI